MNPSADSSVRDKEYVIFNADPMPVADVMYMLLTNEIPFKVILGSYKGQKETSFIMPYSSLSKLIESGALAEQESILVLSAYNGEGYRKASIVQVNTGEQMYAGDFVPVSRQEAELHPSWSYDPLGNSFFIMENTSIGPVS